MLEELGEITRACTILRCHRCPPASQRGATARGGQPRHAKVCLQSVAYGSCGAAWTVVHSIRGITALLGWMGALDDGPPGGQSRRPQLAVRHRSLTPPRKNHSHNVAACQVQRRATMWRSSSPAASAAMAVVERWAWLSQRCTRLRGIPCSLQATPKPCRKPLGLA